MIFVRVENFITLVKKIRKKKRWAELKTQLHEFHAKKSWASSIWSTESYVHPVHDIYPIRISN